MHQKELNDKLYFNYSPTKLLRIIAGHDCEEEYPGVLKKISKRLEYRSWKEMEKNTMAYCYMYNDVRSKREKFYSTLGDDLLHVLSDQIVYKTGLK